jgi:TPR repeat protein
MFMTVRNCKKCEGKMSDAAPTCPVCGTAVPRADSAPPAGQPAKSGGKYFTLIGIIAVGLVAAVLLALSQTSCTPTASTTAVAVIPDVEGLRAKAEKGDAEAQYNLGKLYAKGLGVKEDYKQAAKWYRQAADRGHAGAQVALGELHEAGQGAPRDHAEAAKLYRQAAEQGNAAGQYSLAALYVIGRGVPQDNAQALKWYRQAANQGDALAQYNLGMRYYEGKGVAREPVEAYQWLTLAAKEIPDAVQALDNLKRTMTREQIAEGQRRATAFVPSKPVPAAK